MKILKKAIMLPLVFTLIFTSYIGFGENFSAKISSVFAADPVQSLNVSYFNMPTEISSDAIGGEIVIGSDGNFWFTVDTTGPNSFASDSASLIKPVTGSIGRITTTGVITMFSIPSSGNIPNDNSVISNAFNITSGSDGNLWFTNASANKIGKITTSGQITEYALPDSGMLPRSIIAGSDGNIWVIVSGKQGSKMISFNSAGVIIKEFALPGISLGDTIALGPDGNFWFGGGTSYDLGRVNSDGIFSDFSLGGRPVDIIPGANNDLWVGLNGAVLTRVTTGGSITAYPDPTSGDLAWELAKDSQNNIWFKDSLTDKIRKIGPNGGDITTMLLSDSSGFKIGSRDMVFGQDGNIWFLYDRRIGRIDISTPTIAPTPTPTITPTPTPTPTMSAPDRINLAPKGSYSIPQGKKVIIVGDVAIDGINYFDDKENTVGVNILTDGKTHLIYAEWGSSLDVYAETVTTDIINQNYSQLVNALKNQNLIIDLTSLNQLLPTPTFFTFASIGVGQTYNVLAGQKIMITADVQIDGLRYYDNKENTVGVDVIMDEKPHTIVFPYGGTLRIFTSAATTQYIKITYDETVKSITDSGKSIDSTSLNQLFPAPQTSSVIPIVPAGGNYNVPVGQRIIIYGDVKIDGVTRFDSDPNTMAINVLTDGKNHNIVFPYGGSARVFTDAATNQLIINYFINDVFNITDLGKSLDPNVLIQL